MRYLIGEADAGRGACQLKSLMDFERDFELFDGISRTSDSSADAYFEMDEDFPDDIRTEDFIVELTSLLVISERTRQALDATGMKNNEFLPVTILNHKGRKEKGPFHILHQVMLQDCIDFEKTVCERNALDPDLLSSISQLALDERRIDPTVSLFRMKHFPYAPMFREDLVEKIRAAGLTGIKFTDPSLFKY